jgi:hypothetical protein
MIPVKALSDEDSMFGTLASQYQTLAEYVGVQWIQHRLSQWAPFEIKRPSQPTVTSGTLLELQYFD